MIRMYHVNLKHTDNRKDPDYVFDINSETDESEHDDCNMSTITQEQSYINENKYIVFESAIENLIMRLKCDCPVDSEDIVKDLSEGTSITSYNEVEFTTSYWQNASRKLACFCFYSFQWTDLLTYFTIC